MKAFLLGVFFLIAGAVGAIALKHYGLDNRLLIFPVVSIIIGGMFQFYAFFFAKKDMDRVDLKYRRTMQEIEMFNSLKHTKH